MGNSCSSNDKHLNSVKVEEKEKLLNLHLIKI